MSSTNGASLAQKQEFFDELQKLTRNDSNVEDCTLKRAVDAMKKHRAKASSSRRVVQAKDQRSVKIPLPVLPQPTLTTTCSLPTRGTRISQQHADAAAASNVKPSTLADIRFFYIPNNETNPARRFRIRKAIQHGAIWIRHWDKSAAEVTHIIVDKHITLDDVLKCTGEPSKVKLVQRYILVNERYISDSVSYRCLPDHRSSLYRVIGTEEEQKPVLSPNLASAVEISRGPRQKTFLGRGGRAESTSPDVNSDLKHAQTSLKRCEVQGDLHEIYGPLEAVINQAKATIHLPLDLADEHDKQVEDENLNSDLKWTMATQRAKKVIDAPPWQQAFSCMQPHAQSTSASNPNIHTIQILQEMATYYDQCQDKWRTLSYRKAISTLKKQDTLISTRDEAIRLDCIGERIAAKIEEIVCTNRLRRLESALAEPQDNALRAFLKIYGVGFAQASQWVQRGYRSIEDMLAKERSTLNAAQRIGVEHLEDFNTRIPRAEIEALGETISSLIREVDPAVTLTLGGSYRRGASTSGDIDILVARPNTGIDFLRTLLLQRLVPTLFERGVFTAVLAECQDDAGSSWKGACQLPLSLFPADSILGKQLAADPLSANRPWRRVDLLLVPWDERGAALIYFTGNDIFNRSIRLLASKLGYRLNQRGLYKDVMRGKGRERLTEGTKVEGESEEAIFSLLGVPWVQPSLRNC